MQKLSCFELEFSFSPEELPAWEPGEDNEIYKDSWDNPRWVVNFSTGEFRFRMSDDDEIQTGGKMTDEMVADAVIALLGAKYSVEVSGDKIILKLIKD